MGACRTRSGDDETGVSYITDAGERAELAKKAKARLEKKVGAGYRVEATAERIEDPGSGSIDVSLQTTLWPRFGAKLALAFGREVLGDTWVSSETAAGLRRVLWNEPGAPKPNPLWEQSDSNDAFARLVPPPQHMVAVWSFDSGCALLVQLFGGLRYGVPLSDRGTVTEPTVWIFDPVDGTARQTTLEQLIAEQAPPQSH